MKPLLFLLLTCGAQAQQWRLLSSSKAVSLGHGAEYVTKQIAGPAKAEIRLVVFDEKQCELHVVANDNPKTAWKLDESVTPGKRWPSATAATSTSVETLARQGWKSRKELAATSLSQENGWAG